MDKCTGCGICQEKCPSKKPLNEFNRGLNNRSAIYTPFAQAIPNVPVIDATACIKLNTGKCGICEKFCQAGAIDYTQQDEIITEAYGAIVVATGFDTIKLDKYGEYAYNESKILSRTVEYIPLMKKTHDKIKGYYFDYSRIYRNKPDDVTFQRDRTWQFNNLKPREYK